MKEFNFINQTTWCNEFSTTYNSHFTLQVFNLNNRYYYIDSELDWVLADETGNIPLHRTRTDYFNLYGL